jgi:hypothetical protein
MADEMIIESDEADEGWESDEAFMEADDSVEDLGERAQQRRRHRNNRYRPGRGVRGMTMRDADGRAHKYAFPAPVATSAETNRGLASQEVGRRALEARIDRLEARNRQQLKNSASISGIVTLVLGGGLTAISIFKVQQGQGSGSLLNKWADQSTAQMATVAAVGQLAATTAGMLVNHGYHRSPVGIAADAFAAVQIAGFTLASLQPANQLQNFTSVKDKAAVDAAAASPGAAIGDRIYDEQDDKWFVVSSGFPNGQLVAVPLATS